MSTVLTRLRLEIAEERRWAAWHENQDRPNLDKIRSHEDAAAALEVIYRKLSLEMES